MSDLDKLLKRYSSGVAKIARALVGVARKSAPGAQEKVHFGWRNITYSYGGMKHAACAIGPLTSYVNVYFFKGAKLKDPAKLLEGVGKKVRHVKVRSVEEARHRALAQLLRAAAKIVGQ